MIRIEKPTEEQIYALMRFHEAAAALYDQHDQKSMAKWSREMVESWRAKLKSAEAVKGAKPE
jgi:hypothetical protein